MRQSLPEKVLPTPFLERCSEALDNHELIILLKIISKEFQRSRLLRFQSVIVDQVDNSRYDLNQWLKVLCYFQQWLDKSSSQAPLNEMIDYLWCCENTPAGSCFSLEELLKSMLVEHGFEAARPSYGAFL